MHKIVDLEGGILLSNFTERSIGDEFFPFLVGERMKIW